MNNIIVGNFQTTADIDPDEVAKAAVGELDVIVLIGVDKSGEDYYASSIGSIADILYLLERYKKSLLENEDG